MNELLAKAVKSLWHPVENLFGFSFPSQSEIRCWQAKLVIECKTWPWPELEFAWTIACSRRSEKNSRRRKKTRGRLTLAPTRSPSPLIFPVYNRHWPPLSTIWTPGIGYLNKYRFFFFFAISRVGPAWVRTLRSKIDWVNLIFAVLSLTFI